MLILFIFLALVFAAGIYLFFAPFYFELNTVKNVFRLRFHHLLSVSLNPDWGIEVRLAWWRLNISSWKRERSEKKSGPKQVTARKRRMSIDQITALVKSFKVKACHVNLDFGDMQLNGFLYPFFCWLSWRSRKHFEINFIGRTEINIALQNSIARMSWALISSKYKS
jgi:hypothetical protein